MKSYVKRPYEKKKTEIEDGPDKENGSLKSITTYGTCITFEASMSEINFLPINHSRLPFMNGI